MTPERMGRVALGCIVAVIAGIVLERMCLTNPVPPTVCWLLFVVVVAMAINSTRGERFRDLAWLSALPAVTPLLVVAYPLVFLGGDLCFSGVRLGIQRTGLLIGFALFFVTVSWFAITLFAFARTSLLRFLRRATEPGTLTRVETADKVLKTSVAVVGSLGLLYWSIVGK
jgi:hypothetical protein